MHVPLLAHDNCLSTSYRNCYFQLFVLTRPTNDESLQVDEDIPQRKELIQHMCVRRPSTAETSEERAILGHGV